MDRTLDIDVKGRDHDGFFFHGQGLLEWADGVWHGTVATPLGMMEFTLTPKVEEATPEPAVGGEAPAPVVMPTLNSAAATPDQFAPAPEVAAAKPPKAPAVAQAAPAPEPPKDVTDGPANT